MKYFELVYDPFLLEIYHTGNPMYYLRLEKFTHVHPDRVGFFKLYNSKHKHDLLKIPSNHTVRDILRLDIRVFMFI